MLSSGVNSDKSLELIQKTYHLQTENTNIENSSQTRQTITKVSNHQPSRKTSVHDVQEATREDLIKVMFLYKIILIILVCMLNIDSSRDT